LVWFGLTRAGIAAALLVMSLGKFSAGTQSTHHRYCTSKMFLSAGEVVLSWQVRWRWDFFSFIEIFLQKQFLKKSFGYCFLEKIFLKKKMIFFDFF